MAYMANGASSARAAHARASRAQARAEYSSCIIFVVYMYSIQSAERVARRVLDSLLEFPVPSSHGSKD